MENLNNESISNRVENIVAKGEISYFEQKAFCMWDRVNVVNFILQQDVIM